MVVPDRHGYGSVSGGRWLEARLHVGRGDGVGPCARGDHAVSARHDRGGQRGPSERAVRIREGLRSTRNWIRISPLRGGAARGTLGALGRV